MKIGSRTLVACALGLSGLLAIACDEPMTTPDGGRRQMDAGGGGGGGGGDYDGGGGGGGGDQDGGGNGGDDDCASRAAAYCSRFEECNPNGFIGAFENMDICIEVQTEACENPSPWNFEPVDRAACEAAQAEGCDAFFPGVGGLPAACAPAPGPVTRDGSCGLDAQCGTENGTRLYCRGVQNPVCEDGNCYPPTPAGSQCNASRFDPCDTYAGYACVRPFDEMSANTRCLEVEYGELNAPCARGTEKQCAAGYRCHEGLKQCKPAVGEGLTCDPDHPLCDERFGLECRWVEADPGTGGDGGYLCMPTEIFVPVGAMFGPNQDGVNQKCSAYALPSSSNPPQCVLRVRLGGPCTETPDNCWPGLECRAGTCQKPEPGPSGC